MNYLKDSLDILAQLATIYATFKVVKSLDKKKKQKKKK